MAELLNKQVGELTLIDGAVVALSKVTSEQLLARIPFVGNGTFRSGIMKIIAAIGLHTFIKNKYAKLVATGILVDGMEDLVLAAKRRWFGGADSGNGGSASSDIVM